MSAFCALCLSERGPFSRQPLGRDNALVQVCFACSEPDIARLYGDQPIERPVIRLVPAAPRKPCKGRGAVARDRRERNMALGRCINHPLTDKAPPHEPPVEGYVRCEACIEAHRKTHRRVS